MATSSAPVHNWILEPAHRCVVYLTEEAKLGGILQRALTALSNQRGLLEMVRRTFTRNRKPLQAINGLLAEQPGLEQWAAEVIATDYSHINAHGVIGLWVAIETAVEDTVVAVLMRDAEWEGRARLAGVKVPEALPLLEDDARRFYRNRLERSAPRGSTISQVFEHVLSVVDVNIAFPDELRPRLAQLNYIRNCLLHRGGIVDSRAAEEAPSLGIAVGQPIRVTREMFLRNFDAASGFTSALFTAVLTSRHTKVARVES